MHNADDIASLVYRDITDPLFPFLDLASRRALRLACKSLRVAVDARVRWLEHKPAPAPTRRASSHAWVTYNASREVVPLAMPPRPGAMQPHNQLSCWLQLSTAAAKWCNVTTLCLSELPPKDAPRLTAGAFPNLCGITIKLVRWW